MSIIANWKLNNSVNDYSGNGLNGTNQGAVSVTDYGFNGCYEFDGTGQWIELPASDTILSGSPYTIEAWFRTTKDHTGANTTYEGRIITLARSSGGARYTSTSLLLGHVSHRIQFYFYTGSSLLYVFYDTPSPYYHDGIWHQIVGKHDGSFAYLYYDGDEVGSPSGNSFGSVGSDYACIGTLGDPADWRFFEGEIDEVSVWNHSLTSPDIKNRYCLFKGFLSS